MSTYSWSSWGWYQMRLGVFFISRKVVIWVQSFVSWTRLRYILVHHVMCKKKSNARQQWVKPFSSFQCAVTRTKSILYHHDGCEEATGVSDGLTIFWSVQHQCSIKNSNCNVNLFLIIMWREGAMKTSSVERWLILIKHAFLIANRKGILWSSRIVKSSRRYDHIFPTQKQKKNPKKRKLYVYSQSNDG